MQIFFLTIENLVIGEKSNAGPKIYNGFMNIIS